jgi:hypothetical protein
MCVSWCINLDSTLINFIKLLMYWNLRISATQISPMDAKYECSILWSLFGATDVLAVLKLNVYQNYEMRQSVSFCQQKSAQ